MSEFIKTDSLQTALENISEELFLKLAKLMQHYRKTLNHLNEEYDLSPNELGLMMIMYQYPHLNTANQIVRELGTTKGLASRNVDSLVKKALIKTEQDPNDKRVIRLTLCRKANELCEKARRRQKELYFSAMDGVSEADVYTALATLEKMVANIRKSFDS